MLALSLGFAGPEKWQFELDSVSLSFSTLHVDFETTPNIVHMTVSGTIIIRVLRKCTSANLHPCLCELHSLSQVLTCEDVRIVRLLKDSLQLLQLQAGERGAIAPLLVVLETLCKGEGQLDGCRTHPGSLTFRLHPCRWLGDEGQQLTTARQQHWLLRRQHGVLTARV